MAIELATDRFSGLDWTEALRLWAHDLGLRDPFKAFNAQMHAAARRRIEWKLTFEEWWAFWVDHYDQRGQGPERYCMARKGDTGPYAKGNIYLATNRQNMVDAVVNARSRYQDLAPLERATSKAEPVEPTPVPQAAGSLRRLKSKRALLDAIERADAYRATFVGPTIPFDLMMRLRCTPE